MRLKWVAVISAVVAVALAGCGDSDDQNVRPAATVEAPPNASDTPLGPRLSRAEFIARANAICLRLRRSAEDIPTDTLDDLIAAGPAEQKALVGGLADLRRVVPPEALDSDYERFLDALSAQHEDFQRVVEAAGQDDANLVRLRAGKFEKARQARGTIASDLGLADCETR